MVPLAALWLPIVLAAVIVFIASSIMHIVLTYHQSDCQQLPDEDKLLAALRAAGLKRGFYHFPFCTHKEMKSPAVVEKYKQGPVGMMTVLPSGPPAMPKYPGSWFVYCLIIGFFVAYLTATHGCAGRELSGGVSRRGHRGIPRLWPGSAEQRHLEGPAVGHDYQGSHRWTRLRLADRGYVWLALASLATGLSTLGPRRASRRAGRT